MCIWKNFRRTDAAKVVDERMSVFHHAPALLVPVDAHADLESALLVLTPLRMLVQPAVRLPPVRLGLLDCSRVGITHLGTHLRRSRGG